MRLARLATLVMCAAAIRADVPFTRIVVDPSTPLNPHCKAAGDIDGDGYPDLLLAGSANLGGLYWYQYPSWTKRLIATGTFTTDMQVADIDGDGDLDVVIPNRAGLQWYENPRPLGSPNNPWVGHLIGPEGGDNHDVEIGDMNRDGRLDVVTRRKGGASTFVWLQNTPTSWTKVVASTLGGEGTALGDIDGDGDLDILQNGYWLETPADLVNGTWTVRTIDTNWPVDVGAHVADVNGDGRLDVLLAPSESPSGRFSWYESATPRTGPWIEHIIDSTVSFMHTFKSADIDRDGDLDLVTAEMHQSSDPDEVSVYFNEGGGLAWRQQVLATTGSHNIRIADIDLDGDIDIMGANWNAAAPSGTPFELWRNDLNLARPLDSWRRHVVDPAKPWRAMFIDAADMDRDGLMDIVTGGWWYRNPGSPGGAWTRNTIGTPLNNMAAVYDYDGDGAPDVLGTQGIGDAANANLVWARNNGAGAFTILNNVQSAVGNFLQGVAVGRFQGGALETALSWHTGGNGLQLVTTPANPSTDTWAWRNSGAPVQEEDLSAGDIDRDGDLDLLLGTKWLRNDGSTWTALTLNPTTGDPDRNRLADINRDGRLDAVVGFETSTPVGKLAWYEQPAAPGGVWTEHLIANLNRPMSVDAADMDGDGDIDVVVGEHNTVQPTTARMMVFENADGAGGSWIPHVVWTGDEHHDGARVVDIDNDGDLDIISIGWTHGRVVLYENAAVEGSPGAPVATPVISPISGTYYEPVQVTISTLTQDATIRYTLDNSVPTESSPVYTGPFTVTATTTVRARAFKSGLTASLVSAAAYVIAEPLPPGIPAPGLRLWLKADAGVTASGGVVSLWSDQSGNGVNAAQGNAANRPQLVQNAVNGKPAVQFDGVDDFLTFTLAPNGLTGMTLVLVSANSADRDGASNGVAYAPLFWNETAAWGTLHLSPFQTRVKYRFGTGQVNNLPVYVRPASAGNAFTTTIAVKNGATESLYVMGQQVLTQTGKLPAIDRVHPTGNLGRGYNNNTYFPGSIAEVFVYDRALTDAERMQLEQYLNEKYFSAVPPPPDTTAPMITAVAAAPDSTSAVITWTTDEPADSQVEYGGASYGSSSPLDGTLSTAHSVTLNNLTPGTLYHYRVRSRDAAGNLAISTDFTFTTAPAADTTPPVITAVTAAPGSTTAVVTWTTDEPADSQVEYGGVSYGSSSPLGSTLSTAHSVTLSNLTAGTLYHYRVKSRDAAGNLGISLDFTFTTQPPIDTTPPVITAVAAAPGSTTAVVTWATDEPADSQVEYGGASYGNSTPLDSTLSTAHSVTLTNLTQGTLYHFRVKSRDAAGNLAVSADFTFTTQTGPPAVVPTAGLRLWLAADAGVVLEGNAVAQWNDQSASGVQATQAAAASRPLLAPNAVNGKPAVRFDGLNDFLTFPLPLNGLTGATLVLVSANSADRDGTSNGVSHAPLFWNETTAWGTVHLSPFQSRVKYRFGTGQPNNLPAWTRPAPVGGAFSMTMAVKDGTVERLYVQGQKVLEQSGKAAAINGIRDTGNLGRGYNDNTYFPGDIAEVLVYNRALGDTERVQLEQYLQAKYFNVTPPPPDTTAPVVTAVAAAPGATSAVITWSTDEPADSQVEYGGAAYGQSSPLDSALVTAHSVTLANLTPGTLYHYRVKSRDAAGNLAVSGDFTFTTAAAPPPPVIPTTGLRLWLKADAGVTESSGAVAQWSDQSGSGAHASQAAAASRPLLAPGAVNGQPVVRFDGNNDFLTFTLPVNGLTGMTLVLVSANSANRDGAWNGVAYAPLFWNETGAWGSLHLSPFQSAVKFRFGTGQVNNLPAWTRPAPKTGLSVTMAVKDGATEKLYVDGQNVVTLTGKLPAVARVRDIGNLGRGYNDNTYFPGDIAEVLVYDRALTDAERVQLQQYLAAKFGL